MKGIQATKIHCRGGLTKITEGEGTTLPEAVPSGIPKEISRPMDHP